ncbi:hypothetical protein [Halobacillus litoralis]|uniref:hypothetical protein n=1 Tax=Halobacillus litoralis TaxID=45668 RepID=UPI001CFE07EA|nr:hypothetical protein [Halobacillus litoralis]
MFLIVKTLNGKTKTLKDSNSQMAKTFTTSQSANILCHKLNKSVAPENPWRVERSNYC